MPEVGDNVSVHSKAGPRLGVVTASSGSMLRVKWETGEESSIVPGPGTLTVVGKARVATLWAGAQREFPVITAEGAYVGLVTAEALLRAAPERPVGAVADLAAPTLAPGDLLETSGLLSGELAAAAVLRGGRVVGLARAADAALVAQQLVQQSTRSAGRMRR